MSIGRTVAPGNAAPLPIQRAIRALSRELPQLSKFALRKFAWNVLRAIHVPGINFKDHGLFGFTFVMRIDDLLEHRFVVADPSATPNLDASPVGVVHQKDEGTIILHSFQPPSSTEFFLPKS